MNRHFRWDIQITNKHFDKVLNIINNGGIKIKWYYDLYIGMLKVKKNDNTSYRWGYGAPGTLVHCCWKHNLVQPFWQLAKHYLLKVEHIHTLWPSSLTPICLRGTHATRTPKDLHKNVLITASNLKQQKYSSTVEWNIPQQERRTNYSFLEQYGCVSQT